MYAKVFRSLWEGTLAGTGETWAVFVFLLAHCDREGFVDIHPRVIAGLTGFSEDRVRSALLQLEASDSGSRTPTEAGARLERIDDHRDWGWRVVNYTKYRTLTDEDSRRDQNREAQRRRRQRLSASVSSRQQPSAHVEAEVEAEETYNLSAPAGASESVSQPDEKAETHEDRSGSTNGTPDGSNLTLTPPGPQANGRRSGAKAGEPPAKWKAGFEGEFWPAYLRHRSEGKAAALAVWMRIEPKTQATFDAIMDGLDAQSAKWRDDQTEPRFKPHARTWLFQRRWTDFESVNGKEPVA